MVKNQSKCDRIIFVGVIFLLIFAPLAFGSVHVWAYSLIEFGIFFLLAIWFAERLLFSKSDVLEWVKTPVNLFLVLLLLLIGLQMVPLPSSLISFLSPKTFADKMQLFEVMAKVKDSGWDGSRWTCFAYYLHPAITEWFKLAAYIGMFFLVLNTVRSKRQIDILIYILILVGIFEAVYAVVQVFSIMPKVWWWKSRAGGHRFASGTFIVSNHFAGYMEMVIPLAFGFMLAQKKRRSDVRGRISEIGARVSGRLRAVVQTVVSWFSPESAQPKIIFLFFVGITMSLSLLLSASRGGILSLAGATLLISVLFFTKKRFRKYGIFAIIFCLIALGYGLYIGIDPTLKKFEQTEGLDSRLFITRTIIPMLWDYPAIGVGWGNFRYLYPRYIQDYDRVSGCGYAHNDWIEAGTEVGLAGGILIVIVFAGYLVRMIRVWNQRRDHYALGIGCGVMAGLLSIGFHSYFDFNMRIPANPMTLAALLGIGYAAVHRQGRGYSEKFFYRVRKIPLTRVRRAVLASMVLAAFAASIFMTGRHLLAEAKCATEWNSTMNLNWNPYLTDIEEAIDRNPGNAEYHFKLAGYYMSAEVGRGEDEKIRRLEEQMSKDRGQKSEVRSQKSEVRGQRSEVRGQKSGVRGQKSGVRGQRSEVRGQRSEVRGQKSEVRSQGSEVRGQGSEVRGQRAEYNERAISSLEKAVQLNPARGIYWYDLGKRYSFKSYDPYGYVNKWLPLAEECFDVGINCAPMDANMLFNVGWYWVWRASMLPEVGGRRSEVGGRKNWKAESDNRVLFREDGIRKFQQLFRRSLNINPRQWKKAVDRVWEYFPDDAVVIGIVPKNNEELRSRVMRFLAKK